MTGRSKGRNQLTLGVRCHSGWAAYVILRAPAEAPNIVARGRMELCDPSITGSKQPFHEAEPMVLAAAEKYVARCRASSAALADRVILGLVAEHGDLGGCCVLKSSSRGAPDLRTILASHALIHAAEGDFFRDAVAAAADRHAIPVLFVRERDLSDAAEALPGNEKQRNDRLAAFGKQVRTPWRQDEKFAAVGAWLALAGGPSKSKTGSQAL